MVTLGQHSAEGWQVTMSLEQQLNLYEEPLRVMDQKSIYTQPINDRTEFQWSQVPTKYP